MERPQQRQRSATTFSFKSDKSHSSKNQEKHHKESLRESSEEKRRTHLHSKSKADPNAAMSENQPMAEALEKPTLQSLRSFQHTDVYGNPIAEPDLSNPTRPRWERPLDTIKSFEAAIDNEYKRRRSVLRAESSPDVNNGYQSRRSSYHGGGYENSRYSQAGGQVGSQVGGYYGSRAAAAARESNYADSQYGPMGGAPPRSRYSQRLQSDPALNRYPPAQGQGVYPNPTPGYQQSRDTVQTERSNGSHSDPWANSTDPSSENSSIERALPVQKPVQNIPDGAEYGFNGFGGTPQFQGPILEEYGNGNNATYAPRNGGPPPTNGMHFQPGAANLPPPVPAKTTGPIKLGGNYSEQPPQVDAGARPNTLQRQNTDKRKSWFKRRFSKD
ncbi:hypothetical protein BU16DRAFT_558608 [Lophium mytilinum]|uniref:DUF2406 domain-containing protein n=1 Tax=Lophium mytilinum TaxID=390894 RepID=A0A6A6R2G5_9PEZI|nr:hypothetical protein BU16DRAFT_558608 [Lophium mytilinum]